MSNQTNEWCVKRDDPYVDAKLFNFALTLCVAMLGLVGNTLVMLINRRIKKVTSTDVYITFLAVTDNLHIMSVSLFAFRYVYPYILPDKTDWNDALMVTLIGLLLKNFTQCLNTYTIVMLNLDRYLQVKYFSYAKKVCTPRRARIHFICAIVFSVLFTIPKVVEHVILINHPDQTLHACRGYFKQFGGLGFNTIYRLVYGTIGYAIVLYVVPLTTLTVTNVTLISTVYRRRKWLNRIQSEPSVEDGDRDKLKRNELSAIITLLAITLVFMACQVPDVVLQFIWKLAPKLGPTVNTLTYEIVIINSSINFLIYAISSSVFRQRLAKMFRSSSENSSTLS